MKRRRSIQLKAALLMMIFSLNTIIGFACAVGIDMSFNTSHHDEARKISVHVHPDGKKHIHHEEAKDHKVPDNDHKANTKDNCCNDKVIKFNEVDKLASHSLNTSIIPVFFIAFLASFYNIDVFYTSYINTGIKYFVRSYHPPISDLRIQIQSFQI